MSARHARAVPFTAVRLDDPFFAPRQRLLREKTLPAIHARMSEVGMFEALDVHEPPGEMPFGFFPSPEGVRPTSPVMWFDSDVAKWLEAAASSLALAPDPALAARVEDTIRRLARAQAPDGYLNSYIQRRAPADRFVNLRDWHELYCAGHLIEAAVAHHEATGRRDLLDIARRYVDLIDATFGPEPGKRRGYCGHPGIELALIRLHRATGEAKPLALARFFIDERGTAPHWFDREARARGEDPALWRHGTYEYNQSHCPVRAQDKVVGHAVRAMYLYCAMADLAAIDGDAGLAAACRALWHDLTGKRLYVTGGLGPSASNEGFTRDYDLPNESAYAETCAAVGLAMWAHRMLLATGERTFADTMELALYNAAPVGLSHSGERFTYDNPLASRGGVERRVWFSCPCCPANLARLLATAGGYVCSSASEEVSLHLYPQADVAVEAAGTTLKLRIDGRYPWDGRVTITMECAAPARLALRLRQPGWCGAATLALNGAPVAFTNDRGYLRVEREWQPGDRLDLDLSMPAERLYARAAIAPDIGRVALRRGPVVYCVEEADAGGDVERFAADPDAAIEVDFDATLLGGCGVLGVSGWISEDHEGAGLYTSEPPCRRPTRIRAVPYALWGNRGAGTMAVWLRTERDGR